MTRAKEDKKVLQFDMSRDRLVNYALDKLDEGAFYDALSMLNKCVGLYGPDEEIYEAYVDCYEQLDMYGPAINVWYAYLDDYCDSVDQSDVYEGLAVNYVNAGMDAEGFFYFKKLIRLNPGNAPSAYDEMAFKNFARAAKKSPLRFAYPEKDADYSAEINEGIGHLHANDLDGAMQSFAKVSEESDSYITAGNLLAVCHILKGETAKADKICQNILARHPGNVQTLATLAAMYTETGERDKSRELAVDLCEKDVKDEDSLFKIATVACENGLHEKAAEKFRALEERHPCDKRILYLLAVAEYNTGDYKNAREHFRRLTCLYPEAYIAKFYYDRFLDYDAERKTNPQAQKPSLPYVYRLSDEARMARVMLLNEAGKRGKRFVREAELEEDLEDALLWCFDELEGQDVDLQFTAVRVAIKLGYDDFIADRLLRYDVPDVTKIAALYELFVQNKPDMFGVVLQNVYYQVPIVKIRLGAKKKKRFLSASADLSSRYGILNSRNVQKIAVVTGSIYANLEEADALDVSQNALTCAIYLEAGLKGEKEPLTTAVTSFEADFDEVMKILRLTCVNADSFGETPTSDDDFESPFSSPLTPGQKGDDDETH